MNRRKILTFLFFFVAVPWICFHLRQFAIPGGDSVEMASRLTHRWQFFMRAPLVVLFHKSLWTLLRPWDWTTSECVALSSSIAGGAYFYALFHISRSPLVWLVCLASKVTFIFFGHVENYAWPYAMALACFVSLKSTLETRSSLWNVWIWAGLATFFHPMVLMIWPGLVWGIRPWDRQRISQVIAALVLVGGIFDLFLVVGNVDGFFRTSWLLTPVPDPSGVCPYGLFSKDHLRLLFDFHRSTLMAGLVLLALFWKSLEPGWQQALGVTAGVTLLWSLVWCPTLGEWDWDLFAWPAVFVNLSGGLAFYNRFHASSWWPDNLYNRKKRDSVPEREPQIE